MEANVEKPRVYKSTIILLLRGGLGLYLVMFRVYHGSPLRDYSWFGKHGVPGIELELAVCRAKVLTSEL